MSVAVGRGVFVPVAIDVNVEVLAGASVGLDVDVGVLDGKAVPVAVCVAVEPEVA